MRTNKLNNEVTTNRDDFKQGYKFGLYSALLVAAIISFMGFLFISSIDLAERELLIKLLIK